MTSGVSMADETKDEWDELKPDDSTNDEFTQKLLACYRQNGEPIDIDTIVENAVEDITHKVASNVELAAMRGTKAGVEEITDKLDEVIDAVEALHVNRK